MHRLVLTTLIAMATPLAGCMAEVDESGSPDTTDVASADLDPWRYWVGHINDWTLYTSTVTTAGCWHGTGHSIWFRFTEYHGNSGYVSTNRCSDLAMLDRVFIGGGDQDYHAIATHGHSCFCVRGRAVSGTISNKDAHFIQYY